MKVHRVLAVSLVLSVFSPWVQTVGAQAALPPGVSRRAVLEASLGTPPPVGWKWQVQERTGPQATGALRHTNSGLYYTLEGTHELVRDPRAKSANETAVRVLATSGTSGPRAGLSPLPQRV